MRYVVILIFSLSYIGLHCQMVSDRAVLFRAGEVTSLASLTHEIQKKQVFQSGFIQSIT